SRPPRRCGSACSPRRWPTVDGTSRCSSAPNCWPRQVWEPPRWAGLGAFPAWAIFACAAVTATATVFRDAAMFGALPRLAGADKTAAAVSITQTTGAVAALLAPLLASGAMSLDLGAVALGADSLSCLFAVAGFLGARKRLPAVSNHSDGFLGREVLAGLRILWTRPALRYLTVLVALGSVTGGWVIALIIPMTVAELGINASAPQIGIVMAAGSAGGLLAAATMPVLARRQIGRAVV